MLLYFTDLALIVECIYPISPTPPPTSPPPPPPSYVLSPAPIFTSTPSPYLLPTLPPPHPFPCSYIWGAIADYTGRKPVMVVSGVLLGIVSIGFGFSINYEMAIAFRFLVGITNGKANNIHYTCGHVLMCTNLTDDIHCVTSVVAYIVIDVCRCFVIDVLMCKCLSQSSSDNIYSSIHLTITKMYSASGEVRCGLSHKGYPPGSSDLIFHSHMYTCTYMYSNLHTCTVHVNTVIYIHSHMYSNVQTGTYNNVHVL